MSGAPVAVHARWEKPNPGGKASKTYRWYLPDNPWKERNWTPGLKGMSSTEPAPLYADELLMLDPKEPVCICEGEPAADAVRAHGLFATTWPGGSGQVEFKHEWLALFHGRLVYLWPDNDAPGAKHMAAVKAALGGIAKQIVYIGPTGGPKDDAVDYVQYGGKLQDRLKDVLLEPEVTILASDHLRIRIPSPAGIVTFDFDGVNSDRRGLSANVTVGTQASNQEWEGELSLASVSIRDTVRRQLEGLFGGEKGTWEGLVNAAWSLAKRSWQGIDRSIGIAEMQDDRDTPWLVENLVLERASVVFFARGSSLKSYLTDALVLAVAYGLPEFCGYRIFRQAPVLVIDYEDPGAMRLRMKRLLKGMDFDEQFLNDLPIRVFPPHGQAMVGLADQLAATATKMHEQFGSPPLLVIDSAMPACDGEPEKSGPVQAFFRVLDRLKLATIIISHVGYGEMAKGEAEVSRPYGFVGWENLPRRTFSFRRTSDEDTDDITVRIRNKKSNSKKAPDLMLAFHFEGSNGPVTIKRARGTASPFDDEQPVPQQVKRVLRNTSAALTKYQIQERCPGVPSITAVQAALQIGKKEGWCRIQEGGKGRETTWEYVKAPLFEEKG